MEIGDGKVVELICTKCFLLLVCLTCPGFREAYTLAKEGKKKKILICNICPIPFYTWPGDKQSSTFGCNLFTFNSHGFEQVLELAKAK